MKSSFAAVILRRRHALSQWDATILARRGRPRLLHGLFRGHERRWLYDGVRVINPFPGGRLRVSEARLVSACHGRQVRTEFRKRTV